MPIKLHSALVQNCLFLSRDNGQRTASRDRELQESIPVGCVPSAAVAVGGVCPGGLPRGGVCPNACWDTPPLLSAWEEGGLSAPVHAGIHTPLLWTE